MDGLDNLVRELRAGAAAGTNVAGADAPQATQRPQKRSAPPLRGRARPSRRVLVSVAGAVAGLLVLLAFLPKGQQGEQPVQALRRTAPAVDSQTAFAVTPSPLQWKGIIQQLDRTRGLAFMHAQPLELAGVYAQQSPAQSTDMAMAQQLKNAGARAASFPLRLISVEEQYLTVGERIPRAMLIVVDVMGPYDIVDEQGRVLRHVPARGRRTWNVELERSPLWGWVYVSAVSSGSP